MGQIYNIVELILIFSVFILNSIGIKIPYISIIFIYFTNLIQYSIQMYINEQIKETIFKSYKNILDNKAKQKDTQYIFNED